MARRLSKETRARMKAAQQARWARTRGEMDAAIDHGPDVLPAASNGHLRVAQQFVIALGGTEHHLTPDEAKALRDALSTVLPTP